jgi:hypothetical protein
MTCFCTIKMTNPCKKKRQVKWQSCPYCSFRSGKNKVFQKHLVMCRVKQGGVPKDALNPSEILPILLVMQKQMSELSGRIAVLEGLHDPVRRITVASKQFWRTMKPNRAWDRRKKNAIRIFRAILSQYEGPSRMFPDIWEYFKIYVWGYGDVSTMEIIKASIWPVLRTIQGKTRIYDVDSDDEYHMSKRIWGKSGSGTDGTNFEWYIEALKEVGVPEKYIDEPTIRRLGVEFANGLTSFQEVKRRKGSLGHSVGILWLVKNVWHELDPYDDDIIAAATVLPPNTELTWEKPSPPDQPQTESKEVHDENKSDSGPQSSTSLPDDFAVVRLL